MEASADGYFKVYEEYAKALRTWLVAYGIGSPVFFLNNDKVRELIQKSGDGRMISLFFLIGVAIQIGLTTVNKTAMWAIWYGEVCANFKTTTRYKVAEWVGRQYWMDLIADLGSLLLFVWATFRAFNILVA